MAWDREGQSFLLLLLGAAAWWRGSRGWVGVRDFRAPEVFCLRLSFSVAGWLLAVALFGRFFGGLDAGLGAALILGGAWLWAGPKAEASVVARRWAREERGLLLHVLAAGAAVGGLAFLYQMHDEHALFGHKTMVEQLRRGVFPPELPPFPGEAAPYHYGFDCLAGSLARALGLSSDASIDGVTVVLCVWMSLSAALLAGRIAERLGLSVPRRFSAMKLAAWGVHFGGGLAFVLLAGPSHHVRCMVQYHHPSCGTSLFPTQLLNVYQHPVSLGLPLALSGMLWWARWPRRGGAEAGRWALVTAIGLAAMSIAHAVYFAMAASAYFARFVLAWLRWGDAPPSGTRRAVAGALVVGVGLGVATGGLWAPHPAMASGLVRLRGGFGYPSAPLSTWPLFYAANLGLPMAALLVGGGWCARQRRQAGPWMLSLALAGGGALLVPQLFAYARSWDIVKFPSAASYFGSVLAAPLLFALPGPFLSRWGPRLGGFLLCGTGLCAWLFLARPLEGDRRLYDVSARRADPLVRQVIDWLWAHGYRPSEMVLAQSNVAAELARYGGIFVPGADTDLYYLGVAEEKIAAQRKMLRSWQRRLEPLSLYGAGVRWLVYSDEEQARLGAVARSRLGGVFPEVAAFDDGAPGRRRRVFRVPAPSLETRPPAGAGRGAAGGGDGAKRPRTWRGLPGARAPTLPRSPVPR